MHSIFQPAALICQRTTAPWLLAWVLPGYRRMSQNGPKFSKFQSQDRCNKSASPKVVMSKPLTSCHICTSLLLLWCCYWRNCSLANVRCWENLICVCVLGVSGVPLPILVASSLYLVFTLKRLQTVIRLIKPACYFSASGCFGVLARCPGFGIFRQTQHFGLQKKKDSNCTKIILFKYL